MANQTYQENVLNPHTPLFLALIEWFWIYWYPITIYLAMFIYGLGILFNSVILVVFSKTGFASTTNISFFALAITDLCYCLNEVFVGNMNMFVRHWDICPICGSISYWMTSMSPFAILESTATWITTWVTFERLCCIAFPMKVKLIFTPKTTINSILGYLAPQIVLAMITISGSVWFSIIDDDPVYYNGSHDYQNPNADDPYALAWWLIASLPTYVCYIPNMFLYGVIILATILLIILFQRSNRRRKLLIAKHKSNESAKETKVYKAVIGVCVLYIFTAGPNNVFRMILYLGLLPKIAHRDEMLLTSMYCAHLVIMIHSINHSTNIFVYLSVNPRFRNQFCKTFLFKKNEKLRQ